MRTTQRNVYYTIISKKASVLLKIFHIIFSVVYFVIENFEKAIQFGTEIVENGGEISRAEETVERMCKAFGAQNIHVFIIPSLISVTATINGEEITASRRIYKNDLR